MSHSKPSIYDIEFGSFVDQSPKEHQPAQVDTKDVEAKVVEVVTNVGYTAVTSGMPSEPKPHSHQAICAEEPADVKSDEILIKNNTSGKGVGAIALSARVNDLVQKEPEEAADYALDVEQSQEYKDFLASEVVKKMAGGWGKTYTPDEVIALAKTIDASLLDQGCDDIFAYLAKQPNFKQLEDDTYCFNHKKDRDSRKQRRQGDPVVMSERDILKVMKAIDREAPLAPSRRANPRRGKKQKSGPVPLGSYSGVVNFSKRMKSRNQGKDTP